ncbi:MULTISPECIES: hypothetical protein [unclassified Mesorhizobium]|uniref:hypothetical protein n=1 Tax=unclassified Mesorhizobium TaxID=325217 RepID=UPI0011277353|nr:MULTISPECIES: hypothetical protein [unclassified Mesorhizobium]TPJ86989.1 hypothetical protein FJ489_31070 [Mesorhizobium sp. B2-5-12]TPK19212.1 hypothetical protein FJ562_31475 [Mesorhizobium sp. B2-5-6]
MDNLQRGDDVLVGGEWYPVIGYSLRISPNEPTTGDIFTTKPYGKYEPWLGYRIDYASIEQSRRPAT